MSDRPLFYIHVLSTMLFCQYCEVLVIDCVFLIGLPTVFVVVVTTVAFLVTLLYLVLDIALLVT